MTKKILALLFILCSATNLPASDSVITDQKENNATYVTLVGLYKNNGLTSENLSILTKTQSVENLIEILTAHKECLQSKLDNEKITRASKSMFDNVGKKWAGLIAAFPASYATAFIALDKVLIPMNRKSWEKYHSLPMNKKTYIKTITETISSTEKSSYEIVVSLAPSFTHKQLEYAIPYCFISVGTLITLNCAYQLYQYYTTIKNYEKEISQIDTIIKTIDALRAA